MATLLRLATAGSVDDGKSTLIGRLLFDSKGVLDDQWASVERTSKERGHDYTDLSLLTDGLRAEREQGITIDVAYRYFATAKRKFIIADTPGHTQYTRNMVTGASTAHLAIVLVDARNGLLEQSRRHAFLSSLLGIRHVVLAVNKMDLIGWDRSRFETIRDEFAAFGGKLGIDDVVAIPISALNGDNVVTRSGQSDWYDGPTLLAHLEEIEVVNDQELGAARFPVQYVIRPQSRELHDHRSYAGTVAGGILRPGDEVVAHPSGLSTRITNIEGPTGPVEEAFAPMAVAITLADDLDISRGDMLSHPGSPPRVTRDVEAMVCWMGDAASLHPGEELLVKHTTRTTRATVVSVDHRLDINSLELDPEAGSLMLNEIGRISLRTHVPLLVDDYAKNRTSGSFILIDPATNNTVGAGMVVAPSRSPNVTRPKSLTTAADRLSHGATVWFTGLSGSGKSTVGMHAERQLLAAGRPAFVLDGDTLRHGLNADLGFSLADRTENLRRMAHVAALLAASGQVVLVTAISPLATHRALAREIHEQAGIELIEVFMDSPLELCEARDPKGLYARARAGQISDFTGIDSPFEPPLDPDVRLEPADAPELQAAQVIARLARG
ncbi:MAG: adenylyl-sulfate kinase [Mycobacteriales bacterium]